MWPATPELNKRLHQMTLTKQLARTSDILKWQKDLGHVYSNSLSPGIPWIVKVSVFTSIKELCSKINEGLKASDQSAQHADISLLAIEVTQLHSRPYYPSSLNLGGQMRKIQNTVDSKDYVFEKAINYLVHRLSFKNSAASECLQELTKLYSDLPEVPISEVPFKSELLHQWEIEKNEQASELEDGGEEDGG
ncbi:hypothetical protein Tco_1517005 [Tanacetum coccineum]